MNATSGLRFFSTLILLFTLTAAPGLAVPAPKSAAPAKPQHLPLQGTVLSINNRQLLLKGGEAKPPRQFAITKDTKIVKGEDPATVDEVKAGMRVTGSYLRGTDGSDTLTKLQI